MSNTHDVAARQTTNNAGSVMHEHPRGRGFSILSRLARGEAPVAPPVQQEVVQAEQEHDEDEWRAPVLPFDRPTSTPAPRHRRDVDADTARRTS